MARTGVVVAGVGILASGLAAFALLRKPAAGLTAERAPEASASPAATVAPAAATVQTGLEPLLAACPLVDRATAVRLRENPAVAALGHDEFTLLVLSMGDQGLATVGGEKATEIGQTFGVIFAAMSADERSAFGETVAQLRSGKQPSSALASPALAALRSGAFRMPADRQDRLRTLYSAAIQSGLAHQLEAAERTRTAVAFPTATPSASTSLRRTSRASLAPGATTPPPVGSWERPSTPEPAARPTRSARDWDGAIEAARDRVKRAERALEIAERPLPPDPPVVSPGVAVPSIVVIRGTKRERPYADMTGRGAIELRDEVRKAEQAAQAQATQSRAVREQAREQAIARARRTLEAARADLSRIEDAARNDR